MLFLYFSGTGNTKYCVEYLARNLDGNHPVFSIEEEEGLEQLRQQDEIIFAYPVYYSNLPKIIRDYIEFHSDLWEGKRIFLIVTQGLFSGDGTGMAARLFKKKKAHIIGGLQLVMPDCILDVKALKRSKEKNKALVEEARKKMDSFMEGYKENRFPQEGLRWWEHMAGLFGQRLYFYHKTDHYTDKLHINMKKCIGCGKCVSSCPMKNLSLKENKAISQNRCTMCYRCINSCPQKAIVLIGNQVVSEEFTEYEG